MSASSSAVRAGKAFVEISADDSKFRATLTKTQAYFNSWGKAISYSGLAMFGAGSALGLGLLGLAKAFANSGADLARASIATGIKVEALSQLKYAADQAGISFEDFQSGIRKMSRTIFQTADATGRSQKVLRDLGLTVDDLKRLSPDEQFKLIAERISKVESPTVKAGLAMQLFGRQAASAFLVLASNGSAGISALQGRAKALGLTVSSKDASAALEFTQRLSDLMAVAKMGAFVIGGALVPAIRLLVGGLTKGIVIVRNFISAHGRMLAVVGTALLAVAAISLIAGAAFITFGGAIRVVGLGLGVLNVVLGVTFKVLALLLSPMGLVVAATVALAYAFVYSTNAGIGMSNTVVEGLKQIWTAVRAVFNGTLPMSAAWSMVIEQGSVFASTAWMTAKGLILKSWIDLRGDAELIWSEIGSNILSGAYSTSELFLAIWAKAMQGWGSLVNAGASVVYQAMSKTATDQQKEELAEVDKREQSGYYGKGVEENDPRIAEMRADIQKQLDELNIKRSDFALVKGRPLQASDHESQEIESARKDLEARLASLNQVSRVAIVNKQRADAERAAINKTYGAYDQKQAALAEQNNNAALNDRLDAIKSEYDLKLKYLNDLRAKQAATTVDATAEQRAANDKEIADAQRAAEAKRKAYVDAIKDGGGGGGSILDELKKLMNLPEFKLPEFKLPTFDAEAAARAVDELNKRSASGTFQTSALFGFGPNNTAAERTASNTAFLITLIQGIKDKVANAPLPKFG